MDEGIRSGLKELRLFGLGFGGMWAMLALRSWRHGGQAWPWLLGVMGLIWLLAAALPKALTPLHYVMSSLLMRWMPAAFLFFFFYLVLTPYALLLRALGTKFLDTGFRDRQTYWQPKEPADPASYRHQF